jgi:LysM repeat protein
MDETINRPTDKKTRIIYAIVATLLSLFVISTVLIFYHLSGRLTEMRKRIDNVEQKTVNLEKQQTEHHAQLTQLDGKLTAFSNSPTMKEIKTLVPMVNLLEKQLESMHVRQKVTTVRSKPIHKKQYYDVKEGDSLYRISRKFGLSVYELLSMNDLHYDEPITVGQKLVVSR